MKNVIDTTIQMLGVDHFRRPAGSEIEGVGPADIVAHLMEAELTDVTEETPDDCKGDGFTYFRFRLPRPGVQSIALFEELSEEELATVRAQKGHHGNVEFVSNMIKPTTVDFGHVIVGPYKGSQVVHTWFPGNITPFIDNSRTTVKLVQS